MAIKYGNHATTLAPHDRSPNNITNQLTRQVRQPLLHGAERRTKGEDASGAHLRARRKGGGLATRVFLFVLLF